MYKYLARFFRFILPIVRSAAVKVAADELYRVAYGKRARPVHQLSVTPVQTKPSYIRQPRTPVGIPRISEYHDVILVAFDLTGPDPENVQQWLMDNLPKPGPGGDNDEIDLDCWWIANDERFDGSDTDSAVFVTKGRQASARALLHKHGLVD